MIEVKLQFQKTVTQTVKTATILLKESHIAILN